MKTILVVAAFAVALPSLALAQVQSTEQQACINTYNSGMAKVAKATGKVTAKCVSGYAKGSDVGLSECYLDDTKVAKAQVKLCDKSATACTTAPDFGPIACGDVGVNAEQYSATLSSDLFEINGPGQDIASCEADPVKCKCQAKVLKAAQKLYDTRLKTFNTCKKAGLASVDAPITSDTDLAFCITVDPKDAIAKADLKLTAAIGAECADVSSVFNGGVCPGDSDPTTLSSCISRLSSCLACVTSREADNLAAVDCDLIDDGDDSNSSCAGV